MAVYPHSDQGSSSWDTLVLNDVPIPGIAFVTAKASYDYDVAKPQLSHGAFITPKGRKPVIFQALIQISGDVDEWERMQGFVQMLQQRMSDSTMPRFPIVHEQAKMWGVKHVVLVDADSGSPTATGGWQFVMTLMEDTGQPKATDGKKQTKTASQQDRERRNAAAPPLNPQNPNQPPFSPATNQADLPEYLRWNG